MRVYSSIAVCVHVVLLHAVISMFISYWKNVVFCSSSI